MLFCVHGAELRVLLATSSLNLLHNLSSPASPFHLPHFTFIFSSILSPHSSSSSSPPPYHLPQSFISLLISSTCLSHPLSGSLLSSSLPLFLSSCTPSPPPPLCPLFPPSLSHHYPPSSSQPASFSSSHTSTYLLLAYTSCPSSSLPLFDSALLPHF